MATGRSPNFSTYGWTEVPGMVSMVKEDILSRFKWSEDSRAGHPGLAKEGILSRFKWSERFGVSQLNRTGMIRKPARLVRIPRHTPVPRK